MTDASLGGADYELDLDTNKFKAKATEAGSFLHTTIAVAAGITAQKLSAEFQQMGKELFNLVADFDHFIITLGSQGQVADDVARQVAASMLELSRTTLFSAQGIVVAVAGIAQRLETLTGRAVNVADATAFMTAATDLAVASSSDLTSATSALINVMLAYQIPLEDVAKASDLVFNLSRITGVEFITLSLAADRLKSRLGEAAPNLADLGTVLAMVNQQGITGSRGLLVLVSGINALTSGSKETTNELNRLGIGVYDAQGRFVGFRSILDQLSKAYADFTPQQRKMSADLLFTGEASNILLGLIKAGPETFDKFNERINTSGTAAEGARQHVADLNGQMELLKNNVQATAIEMGDKLEPSVTKVLTAINPMIEALSENEDAMLAISIVAAGILVSGLALVAVGFYAVAGAALVALIAENAALLGIPIAVALAVAAVILLIKHFQEVVAFFKGNWLTIGLLIFAPFLGAIRLITDNWRGLFDILPEPVQNFIIKVLAMIDTMVNGFLTAARTIASAFDDLDPTGHLNTAGKIPGNIDLAGGAEAHQAAVARAHANAAAEAWTTSGSIQPKGPAATPEGAGPPVVPPPFPEKEKSIPQGVLDLLALAAAFAVFQAQTGGSIEDFKVFLKLQEANINLNDRQRDALTALNVSTMLLANQGYQLRLAFVQMAEEAARTGRSLQSVISDVFKGLADKATSLLDQILNGPTREGTELQLRIDRLTRQADLLTRGGADESRLANIGKKGTPQPTGADRELKSINDQIKSLQLEQKIRQDDLAIMKDEAILKQKNLQTDRDVASANDFLGTVIENLTGTVKRLDDAMGGLLGRLSQALGIPQFAGGISYVPQKMLAVLDPGEAVLTAQENAGRTGSRGNGGYSIQNYFTIQADMSDEAVNRLAAKVEQAGDRSLQRMMRRGSLPPSGSNSGR